MGKYHKNSAETKAARERRIQLFVVQDGRCHWCDRECYSGPFAGAEALLEDAFTSDHIVPRWRGGSDNPENVVGACWKCNHDRSVIEGYLLRKQPLPENLQQAMPRLSPVGMD